MSEKSNLDHRHPVVVAASGIEAASAAARRSLEPHPWASHARHAVLHRDRGCNRQELSLIFPASSLFVWTWARVIPPRRSLCIAGRSASGKLMQFLSEFAVAARRGDTDPGLLHAVGGPLFQLMCRCHSLPPSTDRRAQPSGAPSGGTHYKISRPIGFPTPAVRTDAAAWQIFVCPRVFGAAKGCFSTAKRAAPDSQKCCANPADQVSGMRDMPLIHEPSALSRSRPKGRVPSTRGRYGMAFPGDLRQARCSRRIYA